MAAHNDFGTAAERLAAELLVSRGWQVLQRNWRFHRKELDLIVRRGQVVAFVEVRARRSTAYGHPAATIDGRKQRDLATAARGWIAQHGRAGEEYRFDVVTVTERRGPAAALMTEYIADAWRL